MHQNYAREQIASILAGTDGQLGLPWKSEAILQSEFAPPVVAKKPAPRGHAAIVCRRFFSELCDTACAQKFAFFK